jgi:hypothetical protein
VSYTDRKSFALDDADLTQPGILTFDVIDSANSIGSLINSLDEVMWVQTNPYRILYRGYVRQMDVQVVATYSTWSITCADVSEILDYSLPVISDSRPAETTMKRLQHFTGNYGTMDSIGGGGYISLSGTVQPATAFQGDTLRTAIEKSIALEAGGTQQPTYYLDYYYQLHAFFGLGDIAAPYNLTDAVPAGGGNCPYSMTVTYDETSDADAVRITGITAAGSGLVSNGAPRWPPRYVSLDASTSTTAATKTAAGLAELGRRQNISCATAVVTGYDGWVKGQTVYVTNQPLGWNAVQCWIAGVSMKVLSGTGYREYTLQLNANRPRLSRLISSIKKTPTVVGAHIAGQIGG